MLVSHEEIEAVCRVHEEQAAEMFFQSALSLSCIEWCSCAHWRFGGLQAAEATVSAECRSTPRLGASAWIPWIHSLSCDAEGNSHQFSISELLKWVFFWFLTQPSRSVRKAG